MAGRSTDIEYFVPDEQTKSLRSSDVRVTCPPDASLREIAAVVLDIFAKNPPPEPAPPEPKRRRRG